MIDHRLKTLIDVHLLTGRKASRIQQIAYRHLRRWLSKQPERFRWFFRRWRHRRAERFAAAILRDVGDYLETHLDAELRLVIRQANIRRSQVLVREGPPCAS